MIALPQTLPRSRAKDPRGERLDRGLAWLGLAVWLVFNLLVLILTWRDPHNHSVLGNYRFAASGWWAGADIYGTSIDGFLYLPSFAVLYTPFWLLGDHWGDVLWHIVSASVLTWAVWRGVRLCLPDRHFIAFGQILPLILLCATAALRNGQATTLLVALMLLATVAIGEQRWRRAAVLLALAFAVKPLGIVLVLLTGALYPRLRLPLLLGIVLALALPLIHPDPAAALHVYGIGFDKLVASSLPTRQTWSDLTGLLDKLGLALPTAALTAIRAVAALLTLWVAHLATRRQDRRLAALDLFALSVCYLMLMNPRTEENTYIMFSVVLALFAAIFRWSAIGALRNWLLIAFALLLGCHNYGNWIFRLTEYWLKPLVCLAFLPILFEACLGRLFYRGDLSDEAASSTTAGVSSRP
jgi:alpha-1,2-mannosyltransferase